MHAYTRAYTYMGATLPPFFLAIARLMWQDGRMLYHVQGLLMDDVDWWLYLRVCVLLHFLQDDATCRGADRRAFAREMTAIQAVLADGTHPALIALSRGMPSTLTSPPAALLLTDAVMDYVTARPDGISADIFASLGRTAADTLAIQYLS